MILNFKKFIEGVVPFDKFPAISGAVSAKHYAPDTFGVEIEFNLEENQESDADFNTRVREALEEDDEVRSAFYDQAEIPYDPDSWLDNNDEPETLDSWLDSNEEPETIEAWNKKHPEPQEHDYFGEPPQSYLNWSKENPYSPNIESDESYFKKMKEDAKGDEIFSDWAKYLENKKKYYNWELANPMMRDRYEIWDRKRRELFPDDFLEQRDEYDSTYEEWQSEQEEIIEKYDSWESERQEIEDKHTEWEEEYSTVKDEYEEWQDNESEYLDDFISDIISSGDWNSYVDVDREGEDSETKIYDYIGFINQNGGQARSGSARGSTWGVGLDMGDSAIEIRTGILTKNDFPLLKKVLEKVWDEEKDMISGGTSAHVHVGMPSDTNAFDLLAMTTLVDEEKIQKFAGENRDFDQWAKLRDSIEALIKKRVTYNQLKLPVVLTDEEMKSSFIVAFDRYHGTNLASFGKIGTVEFRYLSSQVLQDIDGFINWINYFMMLPRIARGRKQIKIGSYVFTRMPNGQVSISTGFSRQPEESPSELRLPKTGNKEVPITPKMMELVANKTKPMTVSDLIKKLVPPVMGRHIISDVLNKFWIKDRDALMGDIWKDLTPEEKSIIVKEYIKKIYAKKV